MNPDTQQFSLVLEGVQNGCTSLNALLQILQKQLRFQVIEIDDLLEHGPLCLRKAESAIALKPLYQSLKTAGAKVSIVQGIDVSGLAIAEGPEAALPSKTSLADFPEFFKKYLRGMQEVIEALKVDEIEDLVEDLLLARQERRQIFLIGNGGSAANASHWANDFAKQRFEDESLLFRVISLTDNVAWLSATANDFSYEQIFVNQLKNLMQSEDLLIAISSSGNSPNILKAVEYANLRNAITYGVVGFDGGALANLAQKKVHIPCKKGQYGFMEDASMLIGHIASIYIYERDREAQQK